MFNFLKSKHKYNPSQDVIYNLLFCDDIELYRSKFNCEITGPWVQLFSSNHDDSALDAIVRDQNMESRIRLLAANLLITRGQKTERLLLGAIVEARLDAGLDVVAAYQDGTARYINHSGKMVIGDTRDPVIQGIISDLMSVSQTVVDNIGPWDKPRLPPPEKGLFRMTFLATDGLYFGQGPGNLLEKDRMGGPVIKQAMALMVELMKRTSSTH